MDCKLSFLFKFQTNQNTMGRTKSVSRISGIKCCVPNCGMSRRKGKRLFRFNQYKYNLNIWLQICNISLEDIQKKNRWICEDYFDQQFISGHKLAPHAFPQIK